MKFDFDGNEHAIADTWVLDAVKNEDQAWLFTFGAYGGERVLVYSEPGLSSLDDALEKAAETAAEYSPGLFGEPDYEDAASQQGLEFRDGRLYVAEPQEGEEEGDEVDWNSDQGEAVREEAHADMTYTEAGWIPSWEWGVTDLHFGNALYGAGVAAWITGDDDAQEPTAEAIDWMVTNWGLTGSDPDEEVHAALKDFAALLKRAGMSEEASDDFWDAADTHVFEATGI